MPWEQNLNSSWNTVVGYRWGESLTAVAWDCEDSAKTSYLDLASSPCPPWNPCPSNLCPASLNPCLESHRWEHWTLRQRLVPWEIDGWNGSDEVQDIGAVVGHDEVVLVRQRCDLNARGGLLLELGNVAEVDLPSLAEISLEEQMIRGDVEGSLQQIVADGGDTVEKLFVWIQVKQPLQLPHVLFLVERLVRRSDAFQIPLICFEVRFE